MRKIAQTDKRYIVGIGASSGGLEALKGLLTNLPTDTGCTYIIFIHLSPDYRSVMGEYLSRFTKMKVIPIENDMILKPNCIYVNQPGTEIQIAAGKCKVSQQKELYLGYPIDRLFESLADYASEKAIGIILSGVGSDGTNGLKRMKECGGYAFVQDTESAEFDGMPKSAIKTGLIDAQLSPEALGMELAHISKGDGGRLAYDGIEANVEEESLKGVFSVLQKVSGVSFYYYRKSTILHRVERRMVLAHLENMNQYVDLLYRSPDEVRALSRDILTGVTRFFRDSKCFQVLKEKVIRDLLIRTTEGDTIRIWVPGCSTGEEAYSIAILFMEAMSELNCKRIIKIFATDVDVDAIFTAGKGIYDDTILEAVSTSRLRHFFKYRNGCYAINREIRSMIVFSPHNILTDPPFTKLDLISCRNMLIHFEAILQDTLFTIFHNTLNAGGYLFLGKEENVGSYAEAFPSVDSAAGIFKHKSEVRLKNGKPIHQMQSLYLQNSLSEEMDRRFMENRELNAPEEEEEPTFDHAILKPFLPPLILINENNEVLKTYGDCSNIVHIPRGRFGRDLLSVISEGLKVPVSAIVTKGKESKDTVQYRDVCFRGEERSQTIHLSIVPIQEKEKTIHKYMLIFSETTEKAPIPTAVPFESEQMTAQIISKLERDLAEMQKKLNNSMSEQANVNEELQTSNEELLTANEELQNSNEELQSVNEELFSVNNEYHEKLQEYEDLYDDFMNFLSSTMVGIVYVDTNLNIRRYSDYMTKEFEVKEQDIGRPLTFLSYIFPLVDILEICQNVIKEFLPDEREITTNRGKVFFMRVAPYRTSDNRVLGCIITLVDISSQKEGLRKYKDTEKQLELYRQANEAKTEFFSRVSHDMRTPMNAIMGMAELALEEESSPATKEYLGNIITSSQFLLGLINDVLDITKIESGKVELHEEDYSMKEFLKNVDTIFRPLMDEKKIDFKMRMENGIEHFRVDKLRFNQIFFNLLSNAVKFTEEGGVIEFSSIHIPDRMDKCGMRFFIRDNGRGMSDKFLKVLFDPFSQEGDNGSKMRGSGLGLTIVKSILESMGGSISCTSTLGKGTEFVVDIYASSIENEKRKSDEKGTTAGTLEGVHVLLAEDNDMNIIVAQKLMERDGCIVEVAHDGQQVIEMFHASTPNYYDVILMDIRMPILDGLDATRLIRDSERPDSKTIPIIAMTADAFNDDREKTLKAGMNAHLSKPIDPKRLNEEIRKQIGREPKNQ